MGGGYDGLFKKKPQSMYFVVIASFAILSYTARVTARKVRIRLAGSWSWKHGMRNFIHGMEPVWNEMATLEWNGASLGWTGWNGPFSWEPTAKQSCGWNVSFSHRLRLRPPGIRTGRPFIEKVLGLKWWKNSLYPAKPALALPKPRLRLRPAGIRTGRHPGLDPAFARWFRTWDYLGMRIASKKCGLEWFPYSLSIYIYIIYALVVLFFRLCHQGDMQKFSFSSTHVDNIKMNMFYICRLHYVDHM